MPEPLNLEQLAEIDAWLREARAIRRRLGLKAGAKPSARSTDPTGPPPSEKAPVGVRPNGRRFTAVVSAPGGKSRYLGTFATAAEAAAAVKRAKREKAST